MHLLLWIPAFAGMSGEGADAAALWHAPTSVPAFGNN
jgi:hypothetical protein